MIEQAKVFARIGSGGQPYVWVPFTEDDNCRDYIHMGGEVPKESFEILQKEGASIPFADSLKGKFWISRFRNEKGFKNYLRSRKNAGFREFGTLGPLAYRIDLVRTESDRIPLLDLPIESIHWARYSRAEFRKGPVLEYLVAVSDSRPPVWG